MFVVMMIVQCRCSFFFYDDVDDDYGDFSDSYYDGGDGGEAW